MTKIETEMRSVIVSVFDYLDGLEPDLDEIEDEGFQPNDDEVDRFWTIQTIKIFLVLMTEENLSYMSWFLDLPPDRREHAQSIIDEVAALQQLKVASYKANRPQSL